MGTNYYVRKAIRPSKLEELKKLVNAEDIYNGKLQEALNEFNEIHIGKSSYGWQFCFDHNNWKYYDKTRKSINDFIQKEIDDGGSFVDEYGGLITLDAFWEMVDAKKDGFNQKTYYEYSCKKWKEYCLNPDKFKDKVFHPLLPVDYSISYPETITDEGLRFSCSTDFC